MRKIYIYFLITLLVVLGTAIWYLLPDSSSRPVHAGSHRAGTSSSPIQHVVIIMLENHSFDNFFGRFPNANGVTLPRATNPMSDLNHGAAASLAAIDGGKMDQFEAPGQYQYTQADIPIYWRYAQQFGLGDNFFSSYPTSSTPNHMAMVAAENGGIYETSDNKGCTSQPNNVVYSKALADDNYWSYPCYNINSLPQSLTAAGLSWRFYSTIPVWDSPILIQSLSGSSSDVHSVNQFTTDVKTGNMATVSWITPPGSATDHPPSLEEPAQNFIAQETNLIMNSSYWNNTAIFVTWDEFGGQYDHVPPPQIDKIGLGIRVPLLVISPYAKQGYISHQLSEFSSFVKFVEDNFALPNLGNRDALTTISDLMDYFDFSQTPQPPLVLKPLPFSNTLQVPTQVSKYSVNPTIGGTANTYTYDIAYTQSVTPAIHNVNIDGVAHPMIAVMPIKGGELYQYATTLGVGTHSYSFNFSNGSSGTVTLPDNGLQFPGPEVHPFFVDTANAKIPLTALPGQPIKYTVTYTSPSNTPPTLTEVFIDGIPHTMLSTGGTNYINGVAFTYTASSLSEGEHYTVFRFDDGSGSATYPGKMIPQISHLLLSKTSVNPTSGTTATIFTFQTTYVNSAGSAPTQASLYVDSTRYPMSYVSGSYSTGALFQVQTSLPAGNHTFLVVFSDSSTTWADPRARKGNTAYKGPNVGASAEPVIPGTIIILDPGSEVD
jgi:phospholipase C